LFFFLRAGFLLLLIPSMVTLMLMIESLSSIHGRQWTLLPWPSSFS
jgi:hypothetical protein